MAITVQRDQAYKMRHTVRIREHVFAADVSEAEGGEDAGPSPHDLFDASVASCKALTMLWWAKRKDIPLEDVHVSIERDDSQERKGVYRLTAVIELIGAQLTAQQREELLAVAGKCPIHKLMTSVDVQVDTRLADAA